MKKLALITLATALTILAGCSSTPTTNTAPTADTVATNATSALLLLESKPRRGKSREELLADLIAVAKEQVGDVSVTRFVPHYPMPLEKPALTMKDPDSSGIILLKRLTKVPTCENTALTVHGTNKKSDDNASVFICVMQYDGGYRTAVIASHDRGFSLLSPSTKQQSEGNNEPFVPQTLRKVRAAVERNTSDTKAVNPGITIE